MTTEELNERAYRVLNARERKAETNALVQILRQAWEEANNAILERQAEESTILAEAESALREAGLARYAETEDKQVGFGVSIRVVKKLDYPPEEALGWAMEHKMALKLDA